MSIRDTRLIIPGRKKNRIATQLKHANRSASNRNVRIRHAKPNNEKLGLIHEIREIRTPKDEVRVI